MSKCRIVTDSIRIPHNQRRIRTARGCPIGIKQNLRRRLGRNLTRNDTASLFDGCGLRSGKAVYELGVWQSCAATRQRTREEARSQGSCRNQVKGGAMSKNNCVELRMFVWVSVLILLLTVI